MTATFPDALVTGYEHLIDQMDNQPKDHHVAAAAIHADADGILTDNVKDFKSKQLRDANISIQTPAALVDRLIETSPSVVFESIVNMAQRKRNPKLRAMYQRSKGRDLFAFGSH